MAVEPTKWYEFIAYAMSLSLGLPTWCPRAPGRPQRPCRSPAGLF